MNLKNVNRRILALIVGGCILMSPMGLTACSDDDEIIIEDEATPDEVKNNYTYDEIKDLKIITVKTDDKNTTWLTTLTGYDEFYKDVCRGYHYVDFFTGVEIVNTYNGISILDTIEFVSEEDIRHYLISYDLVKNNYTKSELKELFDKIKEDNYKEIKEKETENKEKVK